MEVTFTAEHDADIQSIYNWLRSDRDLLRSVQVAAPTGSDHEAMGAVDTVAAVSSSVIGLGQLAFAFLSWRGARPAGTTITITRADGQQLAITGGADVTAQVLTQFLTKGAAGDATATAGVSGAAGVGGAAAGPAVRGERRRRRPRS